MMNVIRKCALYLQNKSLGIPVRKVSIETHLFIKLAHLYDLLFWIELNILGDDQFKILRFFSSAH